MQIESLNDSFTKYHVELADREFVMHRFIGPDLSDPHDHPFDFQTFIIEGSYVEQVFTINADGTHSFEFVHRKQGTVHDIQAEHIHRIVEVHGGECWTLVRYGQHRRETQFYEFGDRVLRRAWHQPTFDRS